MNSATQFMKSPGGIVLEGYPVTVGRYEILRPLAEGGFGQVYLARMVGAAGFHRTVAVKRIRGEYTSSEEFVSDFIKEARIGGYLQHHNVVQVLGFDQVGGHYLLIMEYVDGIGLERVIDYCRRAGEELPIGLICEIMAQAAEGLQYVHSLRDPENGNPLQLIHRDLKPSNLLVARTGLVKITDFGIARAALSGTQQTQAGLIKGTIAYLSPEQARGDLLDHRSDLYSIGAILFELISRGRLFPDDQPFALLNKLGNNDVEGQLASLPPRAEPFLPLLRGLLTYSANDRIESATDIAVALRAIQREHVSHGVNLATFVERMTSELEASRIRTTGPTETFPPAPDPMMAWTLTGHTSPTVLNMPPSVEPTEQFNGSDGGTRLIGSATAGGAPPDTLAGATVPASNARSWYGLAGVAAVGLIVAVVALMRSGAPAEEVMSSTVAVAAKDSPALIGVQLPPSGNRSGAVPVSGNAVPGTDAASPSSAPTRVALAVPPTENTKAPPRNGGSTVSARATPKSVAQKANGGSSPSQPGASTTGTATAAEPQPGEGRPSGPDRSVQQRVPERPAPAAGAAAGTLIVTSRPSAAVFLEGKSIGETPVRSFEVAPGTYTVRLSRPDMQFQQSVQVQVKPGSPVRVTCQATGCDVVYP